MRSACPRAPANECLLRGQFDHRADDWPGVTAVECYRDIHTAVDPFWGDRLEGDTTTFRNGSDLDKAGEERECPLATFRLHQVPVCSR
jgi:hypothetical protein